MKKILSVLLASIVSLLGVLSVSAATTGTITVNKGIMGESYSIYRILDLETYDTASNSYIYRANTKWEGFIKNANLGGKYLEGKNENGNTYYVWKTSVEKSAENVKAFAEAAMKYATDNNVAAEKTVTATSTTITFSGLGLGYYLVNSSVGTLVHLTTTDPNGTVNEKNTVTPDIDKEVKEDFLGTYGKENDAEIGDTINYRTTVKVGAGYVSYKVYDKMDAGLTFNASSVEVYNGTTKVDASNYTLDTTVSGYTFVLTFKDDFIKNLPKNTNLIVNYTAVLNENAVVESTGNLNVTYLEYKNDSETYKTPEDKTITYTYTFNLVKTKANGEQLEGAEFKLYDSTGKTEIKVVLKDSTTNTYRVATSADEEKDYVTIKAGKAIIEGLDSDSYKLEEVKAPEGYNPLTSKVSFTVNKISADKTYQRGNVNVVNYTGKELPETGSFGTTMFMTIGSLLVVGFGLLLVTKLRVAKEER